TARPARSVHTGRAWRPNCHKAIRTEPALSLGQGSSCGCRNRPLSSWRWCAVKLILASLSFTKLGILRGAEYRNLFQAAFQQDRRKLDIVTFCFGDAAQCRVKHSTVDVFIPGIKSACCLRRYE